MLQLFSLSPGAMPPDVINLIMLMFFSVVVLVAIVLLLATMQRSGDPGSGGNLHRSRAEYLKYLPDRRDADQKGILKSIANFIVSPAASLWRSVVTFFVALITGFALRRAIPA